MNNLIQRVSYPFVKAFPGVSCGSGYFGMYARGNAQGQLAGIRFSRGAAFFFAVDKVMVNCVVKIFGELWDSFTLKGNTIFYSNHFAPKDTIPFVKVDFSKIPLIGHTVHAMWYRPHAYLK